MTDAWSDHVDGRLEARREAGLLRALEALEPISPVRVRRENGDGELVLFSSNDYLGLSGDERVIRGAVEAVEAHGLGPRGSPLICGYTSLHRRLEERIADWKQTEAALLCPTGFSANLAVISGLADEDTAIFSDELNHASIIDGCTLAKRNGASLEVYSHCNVEELDRKLATCDRERAMVVTDSVFSMDGDLAPVEELADVCERRDALLVIDEAHGSFVFGEAGRGLANAMGVTDRVDVHIGTLSKGAGGLGGFVATTESIRTLLLNLGRSYIYSTAAPLSVVGGLLAAIEVVTTDEGPRRRLWSNVERLADALAADLQSPIVPVVIGDEGDALESAALLRRRGVDVTAIRPPTVPEGTSRLRVTVSAAHTTGEIDFLVDALGEVEERYGSGML